MNPRRYSQIERALQVLDKSCTVAILRDDPYLLFLFKKVERIVSALYVITGLFSDSEPLKWELRESGALLLKYTLSFKERATVHSKEFLSDTSSELVHLLSLVDLAHIADLISPMNFSILKKELEAVQGIIDGKWRLNSFPNQPPFFDEQFFGISRDLFGEEEKKNQMATTGPMAPLVHLEGDRTIRSLSDLERLRRNQAGVFKGQQDTKDSALVTVGRTLPTQRPSNRQSAGKAAVSPAVSGQIKEERKRRIVALLLERNVAMIKDFSSVIGGCSEKTIQRLLIEMVQSGVLKREGERRWSRYSIAVKAGTV